MHSYQEEEIKRQTDVERGLEQKQRFDKEMVFALIRLTSAE